MQPGWDNPHLLALGHSILCTIPGVLEATTAITLQELPWELLRVCGVRVSLEKWAYGGSGHLPLASRGLTRGVEDVGQMPSGKLAQSHIVGSWLSWGPELCNRLLAPTYQVTSVYLLPSPGTTSHKIT